MTEVRTASLKRLKSLGVEAASMTLMSVALGLALRFSGFVAEQAAFIWMNALLVLIGINAIAITTAIVRYVWTGKSQTINEFEDSLTGYVHNDPLIIIGMKSVIFLAVLYVITKPF